MIQSISVILCQFLEVLLHAIIFHLTLHSPNLLENLIGKEVHQLS